MEQTLLLEGQVEQQMQGKLLSEPQILKSSQVKLAKPVDAIPAINPGLGFRAAVVDFYGDEIEVHHLERPTVDQLLYDPGPSWPMPKKEILNDYHSSRLMPLLGNPDRALTTLGEPKTRLIYLPANNVSNRSSIA
jgi:hypothetical protein